MCDDERKEDALCRARGLWAIWFWGVVCMGGWLAPSTVLACAVAVSPDASKTVPQIAQERVLIVYNEDSETQHLIREVRFSDVAAPFGFVVPTPGLPDVAEMKPSFFRNLVRHYRFRDATRSYPRGSRTSKSGGAMRPANSQVHVLETRRVGSFTAFVLEARDTQALGAWLTKNRLQRTEALEDWLVPYVAAGFYFVAFRFEPPAAEKTSSDDAHDAMRMETIRISFPTRLPFYPYREPSDVKRRKRLLSVWTLFSNDLHPVALKQRLQSNPDHKSDAPQDLFRWQNDGRRPWRVGAGNTEKVARGRLIETVPELGDLLGPAKKWYIRAYRDLKSARSLFGDVVFVPAKGLSNPADYTQYVALWTAFVGPGVDIVALAKSWVPESLPVVAKDSSRPGRLRSGKPLVLSLPASDDVVGGLRVMHKRFARCYEEKAGRRSTTLGQLGVVFSLSKASESQRYVASEFRIPVDTTNDPVALACVVSLLGQTRFDAPPGEAESRGRIAVPFVFGR